jgi:hypothetical protein
VPFAWLGLAAGVVILETITHLADFGLDNLRIRLLDSSYEWSYSHLLATAAFAAGAVFAGSAAAARVPRRLAWSTTCALFLVLLIDNVTRFHEHFGFWPAIYAPILLGLALSIIVLVRGTDLDGVAYAGLALMLASLVLHAGGRPFVVHVMGWDKDAWGYQIVKIALKEGLELAGWTLLVPTLARLAVRARASAAGTGRTGRRLRARLLDRRKRPRLAGRGGGDSAVGEAAD